MRRLNGAEEQWRCMKGGEIGYGWQVSRGRLQKDLRRAGGLVG